MNTKLLTGVALGALLCPFTTGAEQLNERRSVKPGDNGRVFWSRHLDVTKDYELNLDVTPRKCKFKEDSASVTGAGGATWVITSNTESLAAFTGSVPKGKDEKQYTPNFQGKFKPCAGNGGNGGGGGSSNAPGGKEDLSWRLRGIYTINSHIYENAFEGSHKVPDKVNPVDEGVKYMDRTTPLCSGGKPNTTTDLFNNLPNGVFQYTLAGLKRAHKKSELSRETGLTDPTHGDKNMSRFKLQYIYSYTKPYHILVHKWAPSDLGKNGADPQISKDAKDEWKKFSDALLVHEEGHRDIYLGYVAQLDQVVNAFNQKTYIGEACYGPGNQTASSNAAHALAKTLRDASISTLRAEIRRLSANHEQEQTDYENLTQHGTTQDQHDPKATNTIHQLGIPLTNKCK